MAVDNIYKIVQEIFDTSSELPTRNEISKAFIPFSKISPNQEDIYIYSGYERIRFCERDPEFQLIFLNEFLSTN
jgi:hypothetical protein